MGSGKNKKRIILESYVNDPAYGIPRIAFMAGCSEQYATKIIQEYHRDMTEYYHLNIAPSLDVENVFFLFNDNGIQKKLIIKDSVVSCKQQLTNLEALFVKLNLGREIDEQSLSKIFD